MLLCKDLKTNIYYRPHAYDLDIIRGVYRDYYFEHLTNKDIVLDIGGHIGSFSCRISPIVQRVYLFEPHLESFNIAKYNTRNMHNVYCFNIGLTNSENKYQTLYISDSYAEGSHSIHATSRSKQEKITCKSFKSICDKYKPSVIKLDIEGEEYNILENYIPPTIHTLIVEFHFGTKNKRDRYAQLITKLEENYRFISKESTDIRSTSWTIVLNYSRSINNGNELSRFI